MPALNPAPGGLTEPSSDLLTSAISKSVTKGTVVIAPSASNVAVLPCNATTAQPRNGQLGMIASRSFHLFAADPPSREWRCTMASSAAGFLSINDCKAGPLENLPRSFFHPIQSPSSPFRKRGVPLRHWLCRQGFAGRACAGAGGRSLDLWHDNALNE